MRVKVTSATGLLAFVAAAVLGVTTTSPATRPATGDAPQATVWAEARYVAQVDDFGRLVVNSGGEAITVETQSLARGDSAWREGFAFSGADGSVHRAWGTATERLRRHDDGVAQSWHFADEPAGEGSLVVTVGVHATKEAEPSHEGMRFGSLRYGAATWVDAKGRRTPLEERAHDGRVVIEVPSYVLASTTYPAVLDPIIGPEIPVDDPEFVSDEGQQFNPSVATDGNVFLVAFWNREENGVDFMRTDAVGVPLQSHPTLLPADGGGIPDVTFDGQNFVVVWNFQRRVLACRVSPDGVVLDDPALVLHQTQDTEVANLPRIAFGAERFLIVTTDVIVLGAPPSSAMLFDADLNMLEAPTPLGSNPNFSGVSDVVFDGSQFVVAWEHWEPFLPPIVNIGGVFVDPATFAQTQLAPIASDVDDQSPTYTPPAITAVDGGVLVGWRQRNGSAADIVTRRVAPNGTMDAPELAVTGSPLVDEPRLAGNGTTALLTYQRAPATPCANCAQLVTSTGVPQGPESNLNVVGGDPALALMSTHGVLAVSEQEDIFTVTMDASGAMLGIPNLLSLQANHQRSPTVSRANIGTVVSWVDSRRSGVNELRSAVLDDEGEAAAPSLVVAEPYSPFAVSASGGDVTAFAFLNDNFRPEVVTQAGTQDPVVTELNAFGAPALMVHDGDTFLLFDTESIAVCRGVCNSFDYLNVTRIDDTGAEVERFLAIDNVDRALGPAAIAVPGGALILWEHLPDFPGEGAVHGLVMPHGSPPGPSFVVADGPRVQSQPALAMGNDIVLAVWRDEQTGGSEIRGQRMMPDGTLIDAEPLLISTAIESSQPRVIWTDDGYSFLVTWLGRAAGAPAEVYGAWVTTDGDVLDFPGVRITDSEAAIDTHHLSALGAGRILLTYERRVQSLRASRVLSRVVTSGVLDGGECQVDGDCSSRRCEDGACCASRCGECETCNGTDPGTCSAVVSSDHDSCFGTVTCDAEGACKKAGAQPCDDGAECASGFCVEGVCCDGACDGTCDSCVVSPGTCVTKDCGAYSCNEDKSCRAECESSVDCAIGFQCSAELTCEAESQPAVIEQGCVCHAAGSPAGSRWWLLTLLVGVTQLRRRVPRARSRSVPSRS